MSQPQKDAEVLQSLLEPLKDQIEALKEKLRATDVELQKCIECGHHRDEVKNILELILAFSWWKYLKYFVDIFSQFQFIKSDYRAASLNATAATNTSFEYQKKLDLFWFSEDIFVAVVAFR